MGWSSKQWSHLKHSHENEDDVFFVDLATTKLDLSLVPRKIKRIGLPKKQGSVDSKVIRNIPIQTWEIHFRDARHIETIQMEFYERSAHRAIKGAGLVIPESHFVPRFFRHQLGAVFATELYHFGS